MAQNEKPSAVEPAPGGKLRTAEQRKANPRLVVPGRSRLKSLVFGALVALPSLAFGAYNLVATDRFASSASFVVRSQTGSQGGGSDVLDSITGSVSSGSTKSDSYIIRNFITSPDLVRLIDEEFDLKGLFSRDDIDFWQRLQSDATFEEKVRYWQNRTWAAYDHTTGIITIEIQAFTAIEAERLTNRILDHIRMEVNELSLHARSSSYEAARAELEASAGYLRASQEQLKEFRARTGVADPTASAGRDDELIRELNKEIVTMKAALDQMERTILRPGPNVDTLRGKIEALERQRDGLLETVSSQGPGAQVTAELMGEYDTLQLEVEIAKSRYSRMLESLEVARREAERQQRYLAIFSDPYVAEEAAYPRRIINSLICFISLSLAFAIGSFLLAMVRDHRR